MLNNPWIKNQLKRLKFHNREFQILLLILIPAILLRIYKFSETFGFYGDQGQDLLAIHNWIISGNIPTVGILTSIGTFHMGPIYYYLIFPFVYFSQGAVISPALLFLVAGIILVAAGFLFALRFADLPSAFVFALLIALSSHLVFLSKGAYSPNLQPLVCLLMLFCLAEFLKSKNYTNLFFSYFLIGIGSQLHYNFFINIISISLLIIFFAPKTLLNYKIYFLAFSGFIIPWTPFLAGQFSKNFEDIKQIISYISSPKPQTGFIFQSVVDRLTFPFAIYFPNENLNYVLQFFYFPFIFLLLFLSIKISYLKTNLGFITRLTLIYFFVSAAILYFIRVQFWWWYYGFFSVTILFLCSVVVSYLYQMKNNYLVWLPVIAALLWWQIFTLPSVYRIGRSYKAVEETAKMIEENIKTSKQPIPVKIFVKSYASVKEGYEYRYLLETSGIKTFSALSPSEADYVIVERLSPGEIGKLDGFTLINLLNFRFYDSVVNAIGIHKPNLLENRL